MVRWAAILAILGLSVTGRAFAQDEVLCVSSWSEDVAFTATPLRNELHLAILGRVTGDSRRTGLLEANIYYGVGLQLREPSNP